MEKSDLKNGMYVKLRNGEFAEYYKGYLLVFEQKGVRHIDNYIYDLIHNLNNRLDIVEVLDESKNTIWKREEVDWSRVSVDTKVLVSMDGKDWKTRHFAKYEDNKIHVFVQGGTSWTAYGETNKWNHCKLAEDTKESVTYEDVENEYKNHCESNACRTAYILDNYNVTRK